MKPVWPQPGACVLPARARFGRSAFPRQLWGRSFLILPLWLPIASQAIDSLPGVPVSESKLADYTSGKYDGWLLAAALLLAAGLAIRRIYHLFNGQLKPDLASAYVAGYLTKLPGEAEAVAEFLATFQTGSTAPIDLMADEDRAAATSCLESEAVKVFLTKAPETLGGLRKLLQNISATTNANARRMMLTELHHELRALKGAAGVPGLLPVWQMATAMERLVEHLTVRPDYVTPSTLRTLAGGVDSLKDLCVPGLRPDLFTNPPIRLLAVDDDAICRIAVAGALKKSLNQPDLAEHGEAALVLANKQAYDVIFLDVQMPGMDGFELCKRIHGTIPNANTPVVFVTICSDFDARAKSILSGGSHLIGKPFLSFEVAVKALTYARRVAVACSRADLRGLQPGPDVSTAPLASLASASGKQNSLPETTDASKEACGCGV